MNINYTVDELGRFMKVFEQKWPAMNASVDTATMAAKQDQVI